MFLLAKKNLSNCNIVSADWECYLRWPGVGKPSRCTSVILLTVNRLQRGGEMEGDRWLLLKEHIICRVNVQWALGGAHVRQPDWDWLAAKRTKDALNYVHLNMKPSLDHMCHTRVGEFENPLWCLKKNKKRSLQGKWLLLISSVYLTIINTPLTSSRSCGNHLAV